MRVTALTHRRGPLYFSTVTGRPPDEPSVIGKVFNDLALPVVRVQIPEVRSLWLLPAACSYRMAVISVNERYPGRARRVMMALWRMLPQCSYAKMLVGVEGDIDARNWDDVAWALSTRMDPARDAMILDRTPMDYLDFASPPEGLAGKIGIDATTKIGTETARNWGQVCASTPRTRPARPICWHVEGLRREGRAGRLWRIRRGAGAGLRPALRPHGRADRTGPVTHGRTHAGHRGRARRAV